MKRHPIDAALISLLGLLALAVTLVSASGGERVRVVLLAVVLAATSAMVGLLLVSCRRRTKRRILPAVAATIFSLSVIISVAATHWPLRVSYTLSQTSFDAVAQRVRSGEHVATPFRAGLVVIQRAEISRSDVVCLWTRLHPNGNTGFVQCPPDPMPFNLWSIVRLDDRWQFICED